MKTFQEFNEAVALAAPLLAPAAATFVAGAAANILKATSRKPAVQRPSGKITAAERQKRQAREDRRAAAAERNRERAEQGIDELIGSDAERKAAAQARANQPQIQKELRRKAMRERMRKAAERNNIPEAYSKAEKESHIKPKPTNIQTITRSVKDDGKEFRYREVLPKKGIYHNTPVIPITQPITNPDEPPTKLAPRDPIIKSPKRQLKYSLPGGLKV